MNWISSGWENGKRKEGKKGGQNFPKDLDAALSLSRQLRLRDRDRATQGKCRRQPAPRGFVRAPSSLVAQTGKSLPLRWETGTDPWEIPWTEEPGGLQSMGSESDTTKQLTHTDTHTHTILFSEEYLPEDTPDPRKPPNAKLGPLTISSLQTT